MLITKSYESKSSDAKYVAKYETTTGHVTCTCRGFRTPNKCWHVRDIVETSNPAGVDAPARAMAEAEPRDVINENLIRNRAAASVGAEAPRVVATGHSFVKPMLASPMGSARIADWTEWSVEEKFDGHRVIVMVVASSVTAWSRSGKRRELPARVEMAMSAAPNGIYDGELMGVEGGTFADVRRLGNGHTAYFQVFDVINHMGDNVTAKPYVERRRILGAALRRVVETHLERPVRIAKSVNLRSEDDVVAFVGEVWARGGEGAIVKRNAAPYQAGKRSPDFVKVKKGGTSLCVVVGFEAGKNGPHSAVRVRCDEHGIETTVKTLNTAELARFARDARSAIGRELRIEFTEVRDGAFVNPRWDRWEEE